MNLKAAALARGLVVTPLELRRLVVIELRLFVLALAGWLGLYGRSLWGCRACPSSLVSSHWDSSVWGPIRQPRQIRSSKVAKSNRQSEGQNNPPPCLAERAGDK